MKFFRIPKAPDKSGAFLFVCLTIILSFTNGEQPKILIQTCICLVFSNKEILFQNELIGPYRYAFNGKEEDSEGMGGGQTTYDYGFRIYNPALGRFLSVDPLTKSYPWYTPYQFAGNKPIWAVDLDGLEEFNRTTWVDVNGIVYRTVIQVLSEVQAGNSANGLENQQIVHNTIVTIDNAGNATAIYFGATLGNSAAAGSANNIPQNVDGSTAFTLAENQGLFGDFPTGGADPITTWPITQDFRVDGQKGNVTETYYITNPANGNIRQWNPPNAPAFTKVNNNGYLIINNPATLPNGEPYIPIDFNLTPALQINRQLTPILGGGPVPINSKVPSLPVTTNLLTITNKRSTYSQPIGTVINVPNLQNVTLNGGRPSGVALTNTITI